VVLPKQARMRLRLHPGAKLVCKIQGGSIVLTPEQKRRGNPRLFTDPQTGLRISKSPQGLVVTSEDVREALTKFP